MQNDRTTLMAFVSIFECKKIIQYKPLQKLL